MDDEQEQLSTEEQAPLAEPEAQLSEEGAAPEEAGAATPEEGAATFTAEQVEEARKEARAEVQRVKDPEVEAMRQEREVARQESARLQSQFQDMNLRTQETKEREQWEAGGVPESEIAAFHQERRASHQQRQAQTQLQTQMEPAMKKMAAVDIAEKAGVADYNLLMEAESPGEMERMAKLLKAQADERVAASAKVERKPQDFQRSGATPTGKSNNRTEVQSRYIKGEVSWDEYEAMKHKER